MEDRQKAFLEGELKATLADFCDHQQRALKAAGKACEAWGSPQFESHARVAGATSLAGFRRLLRNFADIAADCEAAGFCESDAADPAPGDERNAGTSAGAGRPGAGVQVRAD